MRKINKLVISPEKIMKNEELINLKGGYAGGPCHVSCNYDGSSLCTTSASDCGTAATDACLAKAAEGNCGDWQKGPKYMVGCSC